jgi:flagella basal body P-ring formation protein FlgA
MADSHLRTLRAPRTVGTVVTAAGLVTMRTLWFFAVLCVLTAALPQVAWAQRALIGSESLDRFPLTAQDQKRAQAVIAAHPSLRGQTIQLEFPSNAGLRAKCEQPLSFKNPKRERMWGNVQVMAHCGKPSFTASIPLRVRVFGQSVRAARYLPTGARLGRDDLVVEQAEITDAPVDAAVRAEDVLGQTTSQSISARGWIRLNSLKQASVIQARTPVRVQIKGPGFQASGEGIALTDGAIGDTITVRLSDGGQVSGRVVGPGEVEITVK